MKKVKIKHQKYMIKKIKTIDYILYFSETNK
jgi:hypothetical protein